jgi:hypothetical protein
MCSGRGHQVVTASDEHPPRDPSASGETVRVRIVREGSTCYVPVPFDPKRVLGKVRAPVRVTLNGYTYRSTIAVMNGVVFIPLRKSHREAAGLNGGETLDVRVTLDTEARIVTPPEDLVQALRGAPPAWERWNEMSYTHQREYAEEIAAARRPETRARRIARAVERIRAMAPRKASRST